MHLMSGRMCKMNKQSDENEKGIGGGGERKRKRSKKKCQGKLAKNKIN